MAIRYLLFAFLAICLLVRATISQGMPIEVDFAVTQKPAITSSPPPQMTKEWLSNTTNPHKIDDKVLSDKEYPQLEDLTGIANSSEKKKQRISFLQPGFDFNISEETNEDTENIERLEQAVINHAQFNLKKILRELINDNQELSELAEKSLDAFQTNNPSTELGTIKTNTFTTNFSEYSYKAPTNPLVRSPLTASVERAPTAQRSWGEQTLYEKIVQFCFSWKGLLTLFGFLLFRSILFKLV